MKKIDQIRKYLVLLFIAIGFVIGAVEATNKLPVYEGRSEGYIGEILVNVTFDKGELVRGHVVKHEETSGIADEAISDMIPNIINEQNLNVDNIAGATYSSIGIKKAIEDAAKKANISNFIYEALEKEEVVEVKTNEDGLKGEGEGFYDLIEVEVIVESEKIVDIVTLYYQDTKTIAEPAMEKLKKKIIEIQSTEVDLIAGATFSSKGYLEAVEDALEDSEKDSKSKDSVGAKGGLKGEGEGFYGPIEVEVKVDSSKIVDIITLYHEETETIANPAMEELKKKIIETQSVEVDLIAGASFSSEGYLEAVENALEGSEGQYEANNENNGEDGLKGEGEGFYGPTEVEVKVESGKIVDIVTLYHEETETIANPAMEELKKKIIETQSVEIDLIAGASFSSEGYLEAVGNALRNSEEEAEGYKENRDDGTLKGEGEGFYGPIEVEVKVESGKIVDIVTLYHEETETIANPAMEELKKKIIETQSTEIDLIVGASFSSEGYLEAVNDALK